MHKGYFHITGLGIAGITPVGMTIAFICALVPGSAIERRVEKR